VITKQRRGFAAMDPEQQREIARQGRYIVFALWGHLTPMGVR
jgi:hypothetical protein